MIDDEIYDLDSQSHAASRYLHDHGLFTESRLIDALLRENEKLLDRLEAAEKDAARYRWLRHGEISKLPHSDWGYGLVYDEREALDAHIDAAMASK